jgi:hypothetical protein
MSRTRQWAAALGVALELAAFAGARQAVAQPLAQIARPVAAPAAPPDRPLPLATLERPLAPGAPAPVTSVSYSSPGETVLVRAQAPGELSGPPPVPPPGPDSGLPPILPPDGYNSGVDIQRPVQKGFWEKCGEWFHPHTPSSSPAGSHWFASDPCFNNGSIISPVSNPFFFEDPRALTELRPLFIYDKAPSNNLLHGGNAEFYGLQGRLAFNECWSLVINKLGFVTLNPGHDSPLSSHTGFAEFWLGPKYTFLRNDQTGSVAAVGLTLETPIGGSKVYQNIGDLGLDPYITYGQTFLRSSYGAFNFVGELGYSFAVDNKRAEFFHTSLHLDYDIANLHRFYPLLELNWFYYTQSGKVNAFGFEGTDLFNFGSTGVSGTSFVDLALGFRYKFSENVQLGMYFEFPVSDKSKSVSDYRFGLDMIFRY